MAAGSFIAFQYVLPEILFYNYRRKAQRDILPRNGYQLRLQYLTTPFNKENYGSPLCSPVNYLLARYSS